MVHDTTALEKAAEARERAAQTLARVTAQQPEIDALSADVATLLEGLRIHLKGDATDAHQD